MIEPRCLIARDPRPPLFPECFAGHLKWFHGRRGESVHDRGRIPGAWAGFLDSPRGYGGRGLRSRAHTADKGLEPAASTRWVFLLLLLGPAICWLSLSGRWFRGATVPSGREYRAAHRRSHRL